MKIVPTVLAILCFIIGLINLFAGNILAGFVLLAMCAGFGAISGRKEIK